MGEAAVIRLEIAAEDRPAFRPAAPLLRRRSGSSCSAFAIRSGVVPDGQRPRPLRPLALEPFQAGLQFRLENQTGHDDELTDRNCGVVVQNNVIRVCAPPTVAEPTSVNSATVLPSGDVSVTSRSCMKVWVRSTATFKWPIRMSSEMTRVEVTTPGPVGMATGTTVLV